MTKPPITVVLVTLALLAGGVAAVANGAGEKEKAVDTAKEKPGEKASSKDKDKDKKAKEDPKPACMHCGATCCLVAICVCEPGTKKKPTVEFEVTCDPICVPRCGTKPWPFGRAHDRAGCTSCSSEPCECRAWVRSRKKIKRETGEEDVPTIKRTVAYVCDTCAGGGPVVSCTGSSADVAAERRQAGWLTFLTGWWHRP
jgi:hypothetical protein